MRSTLNDCILVLRCHFSMKIGSFEASGSKPSFDRKNNKIFHQNTKLEGFELESFWNDHPVYCSPRGLNGFSTFFTTVGDYTMRGIKTIHFFLENGWKTTSKFVAKNRGILRENSAIFSDFFSIFEEFFVQKY